MPAVANQTKFQATTTAILAATAEAPLHLLRDRESLALEPVSSKSLWSSAKWAFDNTTHGAGDAAIIWDLVLPDGRSLLDPHHADLLDWLRRLVWSAYAAPGDGASVKKPGTLGQISAGLRYWVAWLVGREIAWPHEIDATVVAAYTAHLQEEAEDDADTPLLTEAVANRRLYLFSLLWRQRFALKEAGIAPMPAPPFGRAGVFKIARKIAAVATGSYRPLPDEVAIPVLNKAMAMLGAPADDVISLSDACAAAYASGMAENFGPDRRKFLAVRQQLAAARVFQFSEVDGWPWHAPLDPDDWDAATITVAEQKLLAYLEARCAEWRAQTESRGEVAGQEPRPTFPTYQYRGQLYVDLCRVVLDMGLRPGDKQLLCRHPRLHALLDAAAQEQGLGSVPLNGVIQRVRQLVLSIRSAAHLVIQAMTGMRISEICGLKARIDPLTGLPRSVQVQDSLSGLAEVFILTSDLSKTEEIPRAVPWVLGYRPKGSTELPPAVQAIILLDRLLEPWRTLLDTDDLFVSFRALQGLPKSHAGLGRISSERLRGGVKDFIEEWVDLTALPDEAARPTMDKELVSYRESHGRNIKTHQLRKCFGYFASNVDRRLLPMLQMNFHHVSAAMTDGGYTGNPVLERDINDVRHQSLALETLEIARGKSGMAGRHGEHLQRRIVADLGPRIEGLSTEDAYLEAWVYVEEAGIHRLFFEPYGICGALSASEMACHEVGGTIDIARWSHRLTPNWKTRRPSLCAGCKSFAIARKHLPYWESRYIDNAAQLRIFEALGHAGPLVAGANELTRAQAQQALAICRKLGADLEDLERRLMAELTEMLNAA
ncbi:hypothetical protein GBZ26_06045 [Azospirillum formosense]|uniref:Integrase n=1 Tax=Azospirillum formosense TaxID=861533 RepID=A0ABX2KQ54_9PROT|nr:hypothetical protein [Azospirillum formosense]MBY3754369.1 hypothetical protein [Azospirillum formosense]NUB18776.1 hypothetical protein [Azospirillum formosense]